LPCLKEHISGTAVASLIKNKVATRAITPATTLKLAFCAKSINRKGILGGLNALAEA
jgi:hypothetical protein